MQKSTFSGIVILLTILFSTSTTNAQTSTSNNDFTRTNKAMEVTKAGKYRGYSTDANAHTLTIRCNWQKWVTCYKERTVNGTTQIEINGGPILGPKPGGIVQLNSTPGNEQDPSDGTTVDTHSYFNAEGWQVYDPSLLIWEDLPGNINYWEPL